MRKWLYSIAIMAMCGAVSALGVTIHKDVYDTATVVLEDFSGMNNLASAMTLVTFTSSTNGVATYNYASNAGPEGYITYATLAQSFDPSRYKSMRIRMAVDSDDAGSAVVQVYPTPIGPAGVVGMVVTTGTTLKETSFDLSTKTANGIGARIDTFNHTNDGTDDDCQIDYIMADLGRTIGIEFDHDGDLNQTAQVNLSNVTVQNGFLSGGTTTIGDAQINLLALGAPTIDAGIYKYVEIRLKGDPGDKIDLFWSTAATGGSATPVKVAVEAAENSDGNYHTYLLDFSDEAQWTGNLTSLRLDPVSTTNATFELDYVRFMEVRGPELPEILFFDDFDDTVDNNPTNPAARATGTLANTVKYYITGLTATGEVAVTNGLLDWTGTNALNGDLLTANGGQNLQLSSSAGANSAFNWAPYVAGETYTISFTYRTASASPLTFGLADTPIIGGWDADNVVGFDFAFGSYGVNWQTGSDGISSNTAGATANTEYDIELTIEEAQGLAEIRVNGSLITTRSIDFENAGRYIAFGEPTKYGGYIDNLKVAVDAPLVEKFAVIPALDLIANGNEFQVTNTVTVTHPTVHNVAGTFGDFSTFWSNYVEVVGWTPYYADPDGLTANIGTPGADDGGVPVLDGTFYLDTLLDPNNNWITLNSSMNYRNGMMQEDILNGVTIKAGVNYYLKIDVSQSTSTDQSEATFTAALTMGAGSTHPATAVSGSLISITADSVPTIKEMAYQTATISGANLLAAQTSGPVNLIFDHVNAKAIADYPVSPNPTNIAQVSQLRIASVSLTVNSPANDLNKDGILDEDDVALANLYLAGDGGETATNRQDILTGEGFTPAQALAYLNLTDFDIDGDNDFDAADIVALEGLLPGYGNWAANALLTAGVNDGLLDDVEAGGGDGFNNLLEYALGGDPLAYDAADLQPVLMAMKEGGTDWFYYIQNRRTEDPSLSYVVLLNNNLIYGTPVTNAPIGQSAEVGGFTTFTNRTDVDNVEFFQLKVQKD
ncbi:MAG: hypothetical protein K9M54_11490 [Kiritimatiellales bacterium]|nr:hypothetical protein [Kiritimatiellales bacterium]MCF7864277.1 hypothetical protein [Kiritimatiellales bacterium]